MCDIDLSNDNGYKYVLDELRATRAQIDNIIKVIEKRIEKDAIINEEYKDICDNYFVESFELTTWSTGLSKFLCTYFDDEVEQDTLNNYTIDEVRNWTVKFIYQDLVPKEDIKFVKESYYKTVKTYY